MRPDIESSYVKTFTPRDRRPLDDWARANVKVGAWSPWEGNFTTDKTQWIVDPLRVLSLRGPRRLTLLGPAAGSKSTVGEVFLAWVPENAPGFTVWYAQDEEAAKEFAETRVQRFLESCENVRKFFPTNRHMKRTQAIHFPHMSFVIQAANIGNVQSKHIRHMVCDETHLWAPGMLAAAHKRTTRFSHNRTIIELSTGSCAGDETDQAWQQGTKQDWRLFCPKCGTASVPKWSSVRWDKGAQRADETWDYRRVAETTRYVCAKCQYEHPATAANGYALNERGSYTDAAADAMPRHWSFHWNCIASDFSQLGSIAVEFLQAMAAVKRGTTELLKEFTQKKLAEAWEEKPPEINIVTTGAGYKIGDDAGEGELAIMAVDVQMTHFWAVVRAFSLTGKSRLVTACRLDSWEAVAELVEHHKIQRNAVVVDSGKWPDIVYTQCCLHGWFPIKGEEAPGGYTVRDNNGKAYKVIARKAEAVAVPTQLAPGSIYKTRPLFLVSDQLSSEILGRARSGNLDGWTLPENVPQLYLEQMRSMVRVPEKIKATNQTVWVWKQIGKVGNHLWDCERYALAAAFIAGRFRLIDPPAKPVEENKAA